MFALSEGDITEVAAPDGVFAVESYALTSS